MDCRRINLFIGYPNVGKSNILEALSLFSVDEPNSDFSNFIRTKNLTTLFYDGNIKSPSEIRINDKHRIVATLEKDAIVFEHQFEREGTFFEKKELRRIFLDDSDDVLIRRSFLIKEDKTSIFDYKDSPVGKANELAPVRKYEFQKHNSYSNKGYLSLSHPNGDNIFNIISTNHILNKEVADLFKPYNLELLYDGRLQEFTILKRTESGIFSVPYQLVADTLQRLIFFKAAILSNSKAILLFEEPEAHMFPPYIGKFTGDIIYDENGNQYFITTHSPFVINDFLEDARKDLSIYVVGYKNGETVVNRLTNEQMHEVYQYGVDLFFNVEDYVSNG